MKAALLIQNVQNDFLEKGSLPVKGAHDIIGPINKIRNEYSSRFTTVFTTQQFREETHISFKDSPYAKEEDLPFDEITLAVKGKFPHHCVKGTDGANFAPEMQLKGDEVLIRLDEDKFKEEMSAFQNKLLGEILHTNQIKMVFITGLTLDFCVGLTAIDSAKKGFDTYVIKDATKPLGDQSGEAMIKNFEKNNVKFITLEEFDEIIKKAEEIKKEEEKVEPSQTALEQEKINSEITAQDKPTEEKPPQEKPPEDKPPEDKPPEDKPPEEKPPEEKPAGE